MRIEPIVLFAFLGVPLGPPQFASTRPAQDLAYFFDRTGQDVVAIADPDETGVFVAALYLAGDLLVVRANHPAPEELAGLITARQYLKSYSALRATPTPLGKFFVSDAGADGLLSGIKGARNIDLIREDGARSTIFNGDFTGQGMTAAQYDIKLREADAYYARLLKLILAAVQ